MPTTEYRIHPGIGVARIGNSTESFIGPESPGDVPWPGSGGYRDAQGAIKRQASRFRIYEVNIDDSGRERVVREITKADATIRWSVHLANRKGAGEVFPPNGALRNVATTDRNSLVIDGGDVAISGARQTSARISGAFKGKAVFLGQLQTDDAGRLLVLGGHGDSGSVPAGRPLRNFANNDDWHDDLCDGPVTATVEIGGVSARAVGAWVVVASPGFAPGIDNTMTWEDQAESIEAYHFRPNLLAEKVSFTRHVYPILERAVRMQWVSPTARRGHRNGAGGDFLAADRLAKLASAAPENAATRQAVFTRLAAPPGEPPNAGNMPRLERGVDPNNPTTQVTTSLTRLQFKRMAAWARGEFDADWPGTAPKVVPFANIATSEQPRALDRAALLACIGGPFYPGIESGYVMGRSDTYGAARRVNPAHPPGFMTARMAVPWQADYVACGELWWPAQRPVSVKRGANFEDFAPADWAYADMVENWSKLGFVLQDNGEFREFQSLLHAGSPPPPAPQTPPPNPTPNPTAPTWVGEVKSYFTQMEIGCMSFRLDLGNYDDVKAYATEILRRVRLPPTDPGFMPKGGRPWKPGQADRFAAWIAGGYPHG